MITDAQVKRGLWIAILAGVVLGGIWGGPRYGLVHVNTWNLMGLTVILAIFLLAGIVGVAAYRESRRDRV